MENRQLRPFFARNLHTSIVTREHSEYSDLKNIFFGGKKEMNEATKIA